MKSRFLTIFLAVILAIFVANFITMLADINSTEKKINEIGHQLREQRILNSQYESILDEENLEDFYINVAETELDYAYSDEIIYVNVTGQ